MQRVTDPSVSATLPAPSSTGSPGYYTSGDAAAGVAATIVTKDWLNGIQEELLALITAAGLTPDIANNAQILQALRSGALTYSVDTSTTANTITVSYTPAIPAYTDGQILRFKAANANTGATTINTNGLGAIPLVSPVGALQGGEIIAGGQYSAIYSAANSNAVLVESSAGAMAVNKGLLSNQAINRSQAVAQRTDAVCGRANGTSLTITTANWTAYSNGTYALFAFASMTNNPFNTPSMTLSSTLGAITTTYNNGVQAIGYINDIAAGQNGNFSVQFTNATSDYIYLSLLLFFTPSYT